ncbi:coiled-coil domain-containing protein [Streptomyces sp. NPDC053086]|uniref:coiled-coil domain-containing protein n=1 Tax=unclassified Streptomyces TaxID=2593676 RepID=UPI0037CCF86C
MPRGRHRHSPPLHRLLPPSAIAGVSAVCALGPWVFSEATVLRALAAVAAATAVAGAVVMRRWDTQAGRQVAELTRARAGDEWRYEERVAELETDLEESRELRTKLEQRLRAKRAELAGLRNEHAALLRRYATAETERASALEGRRLLEIEAAPSEPGPAGSSLPALPPARSGEPATASGASDATESAGASGTSEGGPAASVVFSAEGAPLYRQALKALSRFDRKAPTGSVDEAEAEPGAEAEPESAGGVEPESVGGVEPGGKSESVGESGPVSESGGKSESVGESGPVSESGLAVGAGGEPMGEGAAASEAGPEGDEPAAEPVTARLESVQPGGSVAGAPQPSESETPESPESPASPASPASPEDAEGAEGAVVEDGFAAEGEGAEGAMRDGAGAPPAAELAPAVGRPPAGHFTVPTAVAVVPAGPARRPVVEGGFDFFGTQKGATKATLDSVQNEDLADVVGAEALAVHKAESEAGFKPADERSRGVGQVIDLTAHDETEHIDVQGLRSAAS